MAALCAVTLKTPVILLVFCCILYVHQPRLFIPDDPNFHYGLYDINDMNIIVKESFLYGILKTNIQTKKVFTTKLSRFSYLLMLLFLSGDIEICPGPQNTLWDFCKSRRFKIVHQNVRGILNSHHLLESFVHKTKIDVICISKTHINAGDICDKSNLYSLPGYVFLQQNRNVDTGGGVGIFLKHEIKFKRRYDLANHLESLWIEICLKNSKSVLIGCYYRPPEGSNYLINSFSEVFEEQLTNVVKTNKEIIILGNFNIDYSRTDNRDFKSLRNIFGLKQVTELTRTTETSSTLIDLIITNRSENITNKGAFPNSIADHDMIACSRKIYNICYNPKTIKCKIIQIIIQKN